MRSDPYAAVRERSKPGRSSMSFLTEVHELTVDVGPGRQPSIAWPYVAQPTKDVTLSNGSGNQNDAELRVNDATEFSILQFDVSALSGRTISAATLTIVPFDANDSSTLTIRRLTRTNWVETEATWLVYKSGSNWSSAGGDVSTPTAAFEFDGAIPCTITGLAELVQDAIDNRSGILAIRIESSGIAYQFSSKEVGGDIPSLSIEWA